VRRLITFCSAEERQDQESKRRKLEKEQKQAGQVKTVSTGTGPSPALALTASTTGLSGPLAHPSLPPRPSFDFTANADSIGFGAKPTAQSVQNAPAAAQALGGSNRDVVANRAAIRMANLSAAEMLKAELAGAKPVKPDLSLPPKPAFNADVAIASPAATDDEFPGFGGHDIATDIKASEDDGMEGDDADADGEPDPDSLPIANGNDVDTFLAGVKRKIDEVEEEADNSLGSDEEDAPEDVALESKALKVNADGTVDQEDTIKWVFIRSTRLFDCTDHFITGCGSQAIESDITARNSALR
jgi:5'-3' exoribonuclease 2